MRPGEQPQIPDAALVAAIGDGDCAALRELYDRHAPWLIVRLSRRTADPAIVEEVVQDTFLAVWKGAHRYAGSGEVAAWIWGIGIRRFVDHLRRQRTSMLIGGLRDSEPSAEDRVLLGIEHGDLAGAIEHLSPELREVVRATILDGLTAREAGRLPLLAAVALYGATQATLTTADQTHLVGLIVIIALFGTLGIALASWLPNPFVAPVAAWALLVPTSDETARAWHVLAPIIGLHDAGLARWHLAYQIGLTILCATVALARTYRGRGVVIGATAGLAIAVTSAAVMLPRVCPSGSACVL